MGSVLTAARRALPVLAGSHSGHIHDSALVDGSTIDDTVTETAVLTLTRIAR